ncbi:hypothetical protein KQI89_06120 [Clostridium sp. MSJ-4]|uniref:Transporter n=1 Tax=Clostridium simiarum TaxID=2841506 RepID=A0ABS6EYP7_9CLOT|nr:hypothetical protein [Clostridium simiarum]MBU5591331.1 hypothetical protein [Clostridium simiarum]
MDIALTSMHYIYLLFIIVIIVAMIKKLDISFLCILGVFVLALIGTGSLHQSVMGVFNSFIYATKELMPTIFIISIISAMSNVLMASGINEELIAPFGGLMKNYYLSYWIIGILMMIISWFFWPSPAVALVGAIFLPIAKRAGLPAMGVAVSMNLFGHGIALSSDYIIQAAPKITADAAGIDPSVVIKSSVPLVIVMGVVTTVTAFILLRRDIKSGVLSEKDEGEKNTGINKEYQIKLSPKLRKLFALMILILFASDIVAMYIFKLQGGDATSLIGGTAVFILCIISIVSYKAKSLDKITYHLIEGLHFGFKIFGVVIPIAAFFYLGDMAIVEVLGKVLPEGSQGIVNDLGFALANAVPLNSFLASGTMTLVGAITGLDGSGFSGMSLVGSVANLFASAVGRGIGTLTALGQISAIWVGGGTVIPWALIPVAAICDVDAFEIAKRNMKPVIIGLVVTTIVAMLIM